MREWYSSTKRPSCRTQRNGPPRREGRGGPSSIHPGAVAGSDRNGQKGAERVAGAVQPALHRADRNADLLRDLLVGAVLHLAHHERNAVVVVHLLDRLVDRLAQLAAIGLAG